MSCVLVAMSAFTLRTITEQLKQWVGYLQVHKLKIVVFLKAEFPRFIKFVYACSILTMKGFVGI